MTTKTDRLPLRWRMLDVLEAGLARVWPASGRGATPYLLLLPAAMVVGLLVVSLLELADTSFRILDRDAFRLSEDYSFANYGEILSRSLFLNVMGRSLGGAVVVTAITLILAFPYAYVMVRTKRSSLRRMLLFSLFLPFFIGQVVRAYGWLIVLGQEGLINSALGFLGVEPLGLLHSFEAVVLGLTQYLLPFAVLLLSPAIVAIDEEMELASDGLGAHWTQTLRHVVFPLALPGVVAASAVVFTIALTDFAMPEIMGGGKADFMANLIYSAFFNMADSGLGSALSIILVLLGSTVFAVFYGLIGRRVIAREVA